MKRLLNEAGSTKRRFNALRVHGYPGALGMPMHSSKCGPAKWNGTKRLPEEDQGEE